ncbi:MAG: hypothetical protein GFH27_549281n113 [Chloroflexi bacterium AL-W]|nr:hypothetical protein [Chloroflexi bacterium AL-N1]NOK65999.1 hypothetical protein [Chloroflexi bacterium AL-N10]NOK72880.1 hypothetical protein [Chloroflexi bacterium AL-N5]NOK79777.1 hypothetical protein [Chloroflexi bacterium AL-W]NOK88367.1 hypothetical protein [Chloroflexi bacterium AL-N15]
MDQSGITSPNPDLDLGEGQVCVTDGFGTAKETITQYNEQRRALSYVVELKKMPFFVKQMGNSWRVESTGQNHAVVHMHAKVTLLPAFAQVMASYATTNDKSHRRNIRKT